MPSDIHDKGYHVYENSQPPEDHITTIRSSPDRPKTPSKPSFGIDSPAGLVYSSFLSPLYLYASLKGKFSLWDDLLADIPDDTFRRPTLDVGCGRGMVLLKVAERKRRIAAAPAPPDAPAAGDVPPAYGIDIFNSADQTGNAPSATYKNVAAVGVLDLAVLHTADFTARLPFADGAFALVTASLSLHNVGKEGRAKGVREVARVCAPGGRVVVVELYGYISGYAEVLKELGWKDIQVKTGGLQVMFGTWPSQIMTAQKPA
jgi:SAM-dependent methyltransferase